MAANSPVVMAAPTNSPAIYSSDTDFKRQGYGRQSCPGEGSGSFELFPQEPEALRIGRRCEGRVFTWGFANFVRAYGCGRTTCHLIVFLAPELWWTAKHRGSRRCLTVIRLNWWLRCSTSTHGLGRPIV